MQGKSLRELAEYVGGKVEGEADKIIKTVSTLAEAGPDQITFLSNPKYEPQLKDTRAAAVVLAEPAETNASLLISDDPYYAFMQIVVLLHGHRKHKKVGVSPRAAIMESATVGPGCDVHDFVTISDNARIGANCVIYPGVFIGPDVVMGDDCIVYPNAVIYNDCRIGSRVIIHANATVGEDGFGFATHKGEHHKIPQIGRVILEDDVEIGAGSVVERATLENTIIGRGSKIGDMVAIGHGAIIGPYCLLVPQVGISGSATLGHHCVLGGQAGVVGHIKIGDMVTIGAQSGVANNVPDGASVLGSPAVEANKAKRALSLIQYLPDIRRSVRRLDKRVAKLETPDE